MRRATDGVYKRLYAVTRLGGWRRWAGLDLGTAAAARQPAEHLAETAPSSAHV